MKMQIYDFFFNKYCFCIKKIFNCVLLYLLSVCYKSMFKKLKNLEKGPFFDFSNFLIHSTNTVSTPS